MTTTIITKNSSTASAVPTTSDLVQGELAVNVTDKRLFTENASSTIVELGTNPSSITTGAITATGTVTANSNLSSSNAVLTGGTVNGIVIGGTTPSAITGTNITANTGFSGPLTGNVTGNLTGNVTGNITGDLTGNVTASSGTTTLNNLVLNGTVDFNTAVLTDLGAPVASTDAATKGYVDTQVANVIDSAPAALDTLNELAAALGDDANFSTTITNSIATKLPLAGGTMTGAIAMGSSKITGLADGTASGDAVNKGQLDTKLDLSGGTMTGNIVLGTNSITSTATPTTADELTRKGYVDSILGSATSAATSAAAAATSASNAATSESNASTSASNAATSASNAAASYDSFDDRYLGTKTSDPTLDNDGDALVTGALYFNTTSNDMKVYNGSAWQVTSITTTNPTFTGGVTIDDDNNYSFGDGTTYIQGSGAADRLKFITNASEAMRIDSSGNVGIGTSSPAATLDVAGTTIGSGDVGFGVTSLETTSATRTALTLDNSFFAWGRDSYNEAGVAQGSYRNSAGNDEYRTTGVAASQVAFSAGTINLQVAASGTNGNTISWTDGLVVDNSGNVGIGVTPSAWSVGTGVLQITNAGIVGTSGASDFSNNRYYDGTNHRYLVNGYAVRYQQNTGSGYHSWLTSASGTAGGTITFTERMRLDSSGNLLVGTTDADTQNNNAGSSADNGFVYNKGSGGYFNVARYNGTVSYYNRTGTDGAIVDFRKDGTTVGSIGVFTGGATSYIDGGATHTGLLFGSSALGPRDAGTTTDGTVDLGSTGGRFKDLYLSGTASVSNVQETVYALSGTALDAGNGGIQTKTLAANTTFTDSMTSGEALVLQLEAGASYTVTWPTMTWVSSGGNVAPTLTAKDTIVLWKVSTTLYGAYVGSYV